MTHREAETSTTTEATHVETYSMDLHTTADEATQATSADVATRVLPAHAKAAHATL